MIPHSELLDLHKKVAIVTGGALGIGARIVERLSQAGACVVIADVELERAEELASSVRGNGGIARGIACDVGRIEDSRAIVRETVAAFGRLDVLVNNAGIYPMASAMDLTPATWDRVMAVNLRGPAFLAQSAAREMIDHGHGGSIVNIASIDGLHPTGRLAHYDASKAGMMMLTRSLAFELGPHKIRVNSVAPGAVHTPGSQDATRASLHGANAKDAEAKFVSRVPLGRMGEPDDIARAVLFLASQASDYITGCTLVVDGGFLLS